MSEFMILSGEGRGAPQAERELLAARSRFTASLADAHALLDSERLRPSAEGRRVKHRDGGQQVEPGPFPDTLGTYWAVKAPDLSAAVDLARGLPTAEGERVEVRPIMKGSYAPAKTDHTGRVFAFGVIGNAPNEQAWIRVMDRIDHDTDDDFGDAFIAGVRLEAPRTGRTLVNQRGKVVLLDGPFLESREVIGGLFFMRLPSLDEALAWASQTAFVKLGAAEIREVWRS
jgi:hypothetical protein